MSALAGSVISSGIIYVYGTWGTTGDGFNAGNDTTGDGSAAAPYATANKAVEELNTYLSSVGGFIVDRNYYIRLVSNTGEANSYPTGLFALALGLTAGTWQDAITAKLIFQGWDRAMGDVATRGAVTTTWTEYDGSDRPTLSGTFMNMNSAGASATYRYLQCKDLQHDFVGNVGALFSGFTAAADATVGHQFFGCVIKSAATNWLYTTNNSITRTFGFVGCLVTKASVFSSSGSSTIAYYFRNCTMIGAIATGSIANEATGADTRLVGCVTKPAGGYMMSNSTSTSYNTNVTEGCVLGGSGIFMRIQNGNIAATLEEARALGRTGYDITSVQADPQFVDEANGDYRLTDGSPGVALGCDFGSLGSRVVDYDTEKSWDILDFMNNEWSDSISEVIPGSVIGIISTGRSAGYIQNDAARAPNRPSILFPKSNTAGNIPYFAFPANQSPQGGTVQASVEVADDISFTTNVKKYDSFALKVTASNNKINFTEDGGAERTATIAVADYNTASLVTAIKAALEGAPSATGTYDVTYSNITNLWTIAVNGGSATTTMELLFNTGTDVVNTARNWIGFRQLDTADLASHVAEETIRENFYDATVTFEDAPDYDGVSNPASSGTWTPIGNGEASGTGTPNTDGADGDGTHDIRVDVPTVYGIDGRHVRAALWSGARRPII